MKEAAQKSKKSLWLILALVAVAAVAGVLLAVLLPGNDGEDEQPAAQAGSVLYWNLDRIQYTRDSETGLSTREKEADGLYHVRLLGGGEIIDATFSDPQLINYLDSQHAVGLVTDADGLVVDLLAAKDIRTELYKEFYVRRQTEEVLSLNSSLVMNGMDMDIPMSEELAIYDVAGEVTSAETVLCEQMDKVFVYGDMDGSPTEVFIIEHAQEAGIYWRLEQKYDSKIPSTTRVPDENGVYTIGFAYQGEQVELKCKDKALVTSIDSASTIDASFGLLFDEEGYISGKLSVQLAARSILLTDRYHVQTLEGDTFTARGYVGNTSGREATGKLREDCEIYLVCDNGTVESHIGEKTTLQLGDRILSYTDLDGYVKLIYVLNRRVDSDLYYNVTRKFGSGSKQTTRTPDEKGYYVITVLNSKGQKMDVRTKDKALATAIDTPEYRTFGLKLNGDIVEKVYDQESVTGNMVAGINRLVVDQSGTILSIALARSISQPANMILADDCKIYNVTGDKDGTKYGSQTQLRQYDEVTAMRNLEGKITHIYVSRRYVTDAKLYWNTEAKYDMTKGETSRTPNAEGYYVFNLAHEGNVVQIKTKSKEIASWMDSRYPKYMALKVTKDGIVKYGYDARSLVKAGYYTSTDYRYDYLKDGRHFVYYMKGDEKMVGGTVINDAKGLKIYNISNGYEKNIGEVTKLRKDDKVQFITSLIDNTAYVGYVTERKMDLPLAKNKTQMYNSSTKETTRTPDAEGYYTFELAVNGQLKVYKTKDKAIASKLDSYSAAFALKASGDTIQGVYDARSAKGVSGLSVGRFDVTTVKGKTVTFTRNRPTSSNYGQVLERTLAKNCKVYDVSPYAESFGAEVELKLGDRVEAYISEDGELCYIYIVYACTRAEGPISYCDHCDKEVWWEPYVGDHYNVPDIHYYYPGATTMKSGFTIGSGKKPVLEFLAGGKVNQYPGVTLTGDISAKVGTHNVVTTESAVTAAAKAMKFPTDGSDYEALCPACNETVVWKGIKNNTRIYSAMGSHFYMAEDSTVKATNSFVYSNPVEREQGTLCLHLNGKTVHTNTRVEVQKGTMNIMGQGSIIGDCSSTATSNAVLSINHSSGVLNLYGGSFVFEENRIEASYVLDLNGQTVRRGGLVATVYGKLDIIDTAGGGAFVNTYADKYTYGGLFSAKEGGIIRMHGGKLTVDNGSAAAGQGGLVIVEAGGTFDLLAGELIGGKAEKGGCISVYGGTFNMKSGTISGGTATADGGCVYVINNGKFNMESGTISGGNASGGGNVSVMSGSFVMTTGTIADGVAANGGGNVRVVDASEFTMKDGSILNGSAASGGNFSIQATNGKTDGNGKQIVAKVTIQSGTVSGGTATGSGGNVYLNPNALLTMNGGKMLGGTATTGSSIAQGSIYGKMVLGGTVTGGEVYVNKANTTTITGKAVIDRLVVEPGITVTLDNLVEGASIKVSASGAFTKANENAKTYQSYFQPADEQMTIAESGNVLLSNAVLGNNDVANAANLMVFPTDGSDYKAVCPVCKVEVTWKGLKDGNRASSSIASHWYLAGNGSYENDTNSFIYNNKSGGAMCVHLNGKTFTTNTRIEAYQGTLSIMGSGALNFTGTSTGKGGSQIYVGNYSVARLNIYGGTFTSETKPFMICDVSVPVNIYEGVTIHGDIRGNAGTLNLSDAVVNGTLSTRGEVTLAGKATVVKLLPSLTGKITVTESWTGSAIADFVVYEPMEGVEGYGLVLTTNAALEGKLNGTLKTSAGKTFTQEGTRLKVETDRLSIPREEVAAVAEEMVFPANQSNGTVFTAYCPACNKVVDWIARANDTRIYSASGTHFYMTANSTVKADNSLAYVNPLKYSAEVLCIHMNGKTLSGKGEFYVENGTLNIMGKGSITTDGTATSYGTTLFRVYDATVNLYGGSYAITAAKALITFRNAAGVVNVYGNVVLTTPEGTDVVKYTTSGTFNDYRPS